MMKSPLNSITKVHHVKSSLVLLKDHDGNHSGGNFVIIIALQSPQQDNHQDTLGY